MPEDFSTFNDGKLIYFNGKYYSKYIEKNAYAICINPNLTKDDKKRHKIVEI